MASLRLENVPDELLRRLQVAAEERRRDLSVEVLVRLDASFAGTRIVEPRTHEDLSRLARGLRGDGSGPWLTPEFIRTAREYGRE